MINRRRLLKSNYALLTLMVLLIGCAGADPAQPVPSVSGATAVVRQALEAWRHENWPDMYSCMSSADQKSTSVKAFVKRRTDLAVIEKLKRYRIVSVTPLKSGKAVATVELVMSMAPDTKVFPSKSWYTEKSTVTWRLVHEAGGSWRITFKK